MLSVAKLKAIHNLVHFYVHVLQTNLHFLVEGICCVAYLKIIYENTEGRPI